jgi:hypothetical protein
MTLTHPALTRSAIALCAAVGSFSPCSRSSSVATKYLRSKPCRAELVWLRSAGKLTDRIGELESAMADQPLVVPGHAKQPTSHPLLTEIRMYYALLAQTLGRIRVDLVDSGSGGLVLGNRHRTAALARHYPTGRG